VSSRHVTFAWLAADDIGSWRGGARTWTSRMRQAPFGATSVVASWHATTPPGSWIEVAVRGRAEDPAWGPWFALGVWASSDETVAPTTVAGQEADGVQVCADEVRLDAGSAWHEVQARVILRHEDSAAQPVLHRLGLLTSRVPAEPGEPSAPVLGRAVAIDVPTYSQAVHRDTYREYGGGGQAWCSPTSVSMVLDHFGRLPSPRAYAWVGEGPDRFVPHGARRTFDHGYGGTGNWSFNVAYANDQGLDAFVTRLRSMAEAELFVEAGIPLVLSATFEAEELTGAGYSTRGHLLTLVGFTAHGDPVVNDPASHEVPDNAEVRTTYDRSQLERAWLRGSGGVVYVMRPPDVPLPKAPAEANW
jgi:hypothetical protein